MHGQLSVSSWIEKCSLLGTCFDERPAGQLTNDALA
jgi:hypothetical protein